MAANRRQFLIGSIAAAAAASGLTACGGGSSGSAGGGSSSGGGADGPADLAFAWWGNDVRNKNTTAAIAAYTQAHPKVKVSPQPGEWASYWDKLATQTAGGTAPDIIQMDMAYISEYGHRGALLDLAEHGADTSKFAEGTVGSGKIDGTLYGVNAGINTLCLLANPAVFQKAGAVGSPAQISEEATKTLDQSALVVGGAAMQVYWSNQVEAVNAAAGTDMKILRYPSRTGDAAARKAWYKASMLWSVSAKTKSPEAAVALVNWWVNSTESADINLAERGIPANTEVRAAIEPKLSPTQQGVAKFIADIKPELGKTPPALPPGGGTIGAVLLRQYTDVLFGRASTSAAASAFVDEVESNLTT